MNLTSPRTSRVIMLSSSHGLSLPLSASLLFSSLCVCFSPRTASVLSACSPYILYHGALLLSELIPCMHACTRET